MSLVIATVYGEVGIISGENRWRLRDGTTKDADFKVFVAGDIAYGIAGKFSALANIRRAVANNPPADLRTAMDLIADVLSRLRPDPSIVTGVCAMRFQDGRVQTRWYSHGPDYVGPEDLSDCAWMGSGVSEAAQSALKPSTVATLEGQILAHRLTYEHAARMNPEVSAEARIFVVSRQGIEERSAFLDANGTTYRRPSNVNSNHLLGTKGLVPVNAAGTTTASSSILTQSGTSKTINVAAFTIQYGFGQVSYNSGSVTVSGFGTWLVYFSDPTYSGGAVTYVATQTGYNAFASDAYTIVGSIELTSAGGGAGGIGGGGSNPCFSPNTRVLTDEGVVELSDLTAGQKSLTAAGTWREIKTVTRNPYSGTMYDMGDGLVTPNHLFKVNDRWVPAHEMGFKRIDDWEGEVMNLIMDAPGEETLDPKTEHSYTLANGYCVHNVNQLPC